MKFDFTYNGRVYTADLEIYTSPRKDLYVKNIEPITEEFHEQYFFYVDEKEKQLNHNEPNPPNCTEIAIGNGILKYSEKNGIKLFD